MTKLDRGGTNPTGCPVDRDRLVWLQPGARRQILRRGVGAGVGRQFGIALRGVDPNRVFATNARVLGKTTIAFRAEIKGS